MKNFRAAALLAPAIFLLVSCLQNAGTITIPEKDLIPEGIAVSGSKIFLSSVHKNKIVEYNVESGVATDFVHADEHGFGPGVGLLAKGDTLYALTNYPNSAPPRSSLFLFAISSRSFINKFELSDGQRHFLNDLAVDRLGNIFVTDSDQSKVFALESSTGLFVEYLSDSSILYPNGIAVSDNDKVLFVASAVNGVRIIDRQTKAYLNDASTDTRGIDGMKYDQNVLYAVVNGTRDISRHGVIRIILTADHAGIEKVEDLLVGDKVFDIPTTLGIGGSIIYLIANSQLGNLNQETNEIINRDSLNDTFILSLGMQPLKR